MQIFFDIEVFKNFFQIGLLVDNKYVSIDIRDNEVFGKKRQDKLLSTVKDNTLVGFNSISYDNIFVNILLADSNLTAKQLKLISDLLIEDSYSDELINDIKVNFKSSIADKLVKLKPTNFNIFSILSAFNANNYIYETIDLYKINNAGGLKFYASNLGLKIRELPYQSDSILTHQQINEIIEYNKNDLIITKELYKKSLKDLEFRGKLNNRYDDIVDIYNPFKNFLNMGRATIGEKLINLKLKVTTNNYKNGKIKSFKLNLPNYLQFKNKDIQNLLNRVKKHTFNSSSTTIPDFIKNFKITIGNNFYFIKKGGLHSKEKVLRVVTFTNANLRNIDVISYYPNLQFKNGFTPANIDKDKYIEFGENLLLERVEAKKIQKELKNKSNLTNNEKLLLENAIIINETNKIILNGGMYGKLGDINSKYYDPKALLNVTLTGQFSLLLLIEWLEYAGIEVISSNTDGIEILHNLDTHNFEDIKNIVSKWEKTTKLTMEYGEYKSLFARDVNAYVAKYSNGVKAKGIYGASVNSIHKKIEYPIVYETIRNLINDFSYPLNDISKIKNYILNKLLNCNNILEFATVQKVTGGAILVEDNQVIKYNEKIPKRDKQGNIIYGVIPKSKRIKINGIDIKEYAEKNNLVKRYYFDIYNKNDIKTEYKKIDNSVFNYQDFQQLGNYIRYVYSKNANNRVIYKKTANNVANANNVKIIDLEIDKYTNFKSYIDYDRYLNITLKELENIGYIITSKTTIL